MTVTVDVSLPDTRVDYDVDGDNLIEVANLAQLRAIFHDLNGDGQPEPADANEFHTAYANPLPGLGCQTTCAGYELAANLDFDTNGNGRAAVAGDAYWNNGSGWLPIGGGGVGYSGEFNGNGHTISNLYLRRRGTDYGLFGRLGGRGFIHHVGLLNVSVTNTQRAAVSGSGGGDTGAMVGEIMSGDALVAASFATGSVSGGWQTGGLVGDNEGRIVASWTNIAVSGGNKVGGIAGDNTGMVIASYAIGSVASDSAQYVHGVAGYSHGGGSVRDSYFNTNAYPSAGAGGRTAAQLQAPTDYAGIYANWNVDLNRDTGADDPWDFGGSGNYPLLKADSNGDGTAAWEEFSGQTRSAMALTACAGPDLTGAPGGQVTLEGQCSTNPYGRWHQMAHQWTQLSGPSVTLTHPQESKQAANKFGDPRFTVPADAAGGTTLEFQLTVTDKEDQSDSDTMTITVPGAEPEPANTPPTASIDTAQVTAAVAGETVALQGVGNDAETTAESLTFAWSQAGGTPTVSIASATTATAAFTAPDVTEQTQLTFRLTVTDAGGLSADAETTIGVGPPPEREPNRAPTFDANIDTVLTVAENSAAGVNVGSPITATDPEGDTPAYSLSGADAASFQIDAATGQVQTRSGVVYDYEARPAYSLAVSADDGKGLSASIPVTVNLTDVNEAPAFDEGASATRQVAENSPAGTSVGLPLTATDADEDTLTYTLSGVDAGSFEIDAATGQLTTKEGVTYDYETRPAYSLAVIAADGKGLSASIPVTVNLTDVNEAPAFDEGASATRQVAENSAAGVNVGEAITATDRDGDTLTYSLSGADAGSFEIDAATGQLLTKAGVTYDYETRSTYSVAVEVSDGNGGAATVAVTVSLTDVNETPSVTSCFTNLNELTAPVEYAGEWDDPDCRAHHRDGLARYFHFTLSQETTVEINLESAADAQLFVSKGTPQNGWGTPPNGSYEDRRNIRRGNGKLVHDGAHTGLNSVTLTLAAGEYTAEAAVPATGGEAGAFTLSIARR